MESIEYIKRKTWITNTDKTTICIETMTIGAKISTVTFIFIFKEIIYSYNQILLQSKENILSYQYQ